MCFVHELSCQWSFNFHQFCRLFCSSDLFFCLFVFMKIIQEKAFYLISNWIWSKHIKHLLVRHSPILAMCLLLSAISNISNIHTKKKHIYRYCVFNAVSDKYKILIYGFYITCFFKYWQWANICKKKSSVFIPLYWHTIATSSCTEELKCSLVSEYPIITGEVWIVKLTTVLVHAQYCK